MHLCSECGLRHPTYTHDGKCAQCGKDLVSYSDALQKAGLSCGAVEGPHGTYSPTAIEDGIYRWRGRCYVAEKWLSRLLGIGLNQVVKEADKRLDNPRGLDGDWSEGGGDWQQANIRILEGAIARLKVTMAHRNEGHACRCADCRGVHIDLDSDVPDIEGEISQAPSDYLRVTPEGDVK